MSHNPNNSSCPRNDPRNQTICTCNGWGSPIHLGKLLPPIRNDGSYDRFFPQEKAPPGDHCLDSVDNVQCWMCSHTANPTGGEGEYMCTKCQRVFSTKSDAVVMVNNPPPGLSLMEQYELNIPPLCPYCHGYLNNKQLENLGKKPSGTKTNCQNCNRELTLADLGRKG